jgi:DNA-binding response OmpR family regulator
MQNATPTYNILLVEDDELIASGLCYALQGEGYAVAHANSVAAAKALVAQKRVDLALLDLSLPDGTGFDVFELLQNDTRLAQAAVIFLTAADDEGNTVHAFDMGADDYIAKPFRVRELLARVAAVLRRLNSSGNATVAPALTLGSDDNIHLDTGSATVSIDGREVELTALEYRLALLFASNRRRVLTRQQILDSLYASAGEFVNDNTLTVYVRRLRQKLGEDVVQTVRGLGYKA